MIIWWLFDDYLIYLIRKWTTEAPQCHHSPNFARLCCLKIPVARPARAEKVISDLLDSSLQGDPCDLGCRRWQSYERKFANSQLKFLHLKLRNRSVCWLCVWLFWRRIGGNRSVWARCFALRVKSWVFAVHVTEAGITRPWPISKHSTKSAMADFEAFYRLRNGNRSVWARCFTFRVRRWLFSVQVTEAGITRPWPISKHSTKQQAKTTIVKACIVNEFDGFIHLDMIVINASASKID